MRIIEISELPEEARIGLEALCLNAAMPLPRRIYIDDGTPPCTDYAGFFRALGDAAETGAIIFTPKKQP